MQVMLTCECGQGLRTEIGQDAVSVQCPSCGKQINVFPPAGISEMPVQQKACGNAMVALVLGLCTLVPIVGIITAIPAIVLGIVVLVRKRPGRGFAIAGLSTASVSLLTIQVGAVLYAILIYTTITTMTSMMTMPGRAMVSQPVALSVPEESVADRLDAEDIADALLLGFEVHEDATAASASLAEARRLYDSRELPGNRFKCLREYSLHLARRGRADFADPSDRARHNRVYDELLELVLEKYKRASELEAEGGWCGAANIYAAIAAEVPAEDNAIQVNALACAQDCLTRAVDTSSGARSTPTKAPSTWPAEP